MKIHNCAFILFSFFILANVSDGSLANPPIVPSAGTPGISLGMYRLRYHADSLSDNIREEYFKLLFNRNISRFQSQSSRSRDSLTNLVVSMPTNLRTSDNIGFYNKQIFGLPQARFRYIIYKKPTINQISYYDWIGANLYRYEESILFKWTITSNKQIIAGYNCQKATTRFAGRNYVAWFTREIPISEGPYKFYGLPGLITKVEDTRGQYAFELVSLSQCANQTEITLPSKKSQLTSKADLNKAQATYLLSLSDRMAAMGNSISPEQRRKMTQRNSLELK